MLLLVIFLSKLHVHQLAFCQTILCRNHICMIPTVVYFRKLPNGMPYVIMYQRMSAYQLMYHWYFDLAIQNHVPQRHLSKNRTSTKSVWGVQSFGRGRHEKCFLDLPNKVPRKQEKRAKKSSVAQKLRPGIVSIPSPRGVTRPEAESLCVVGTSVPLHPRPHAPKKVSTWHGFAGGEA